MTMPEHLAPNLTLDLVLYVLRHTLLSPFVAAGLTFFTQYGQVSPGISLGFPSGDRGV